MKKAFAALAAVLATATIAVGTAGADGSGPLFQDDGFLCGVIDRGGATVGTTDSLITWYQSGKVHLRCEADGTPGATIETTTGFPCGLGQFGGTTDSRNVVRRAGRIQLDCYGHADPDVANAAAAGGYGVG